MEQITHSVLILSKLMNGMILSGIGSCFQIRAEKHLVIVLIKSFCYTVCPPIFEHFIQNQYYLPYGIFGIIWILYG